MRPWPPLLRLLWRQPDLVVEHTSAYLALAADETGAAVQSLARQWLYRLVAMACATAALVLAGVALLLWAALPLLAASAWLLWLVPLLPLPLAVWAWHSALAPPAPLFAGLQAQIGLDRAAWRAASHRAGAR